MTTYGVVVQFVPPLLPGVTLATLEGWGSDVDGTGCRVTLTRTPATVAKPPAAPTMSVVP